MIDNDARVNFRGCLCMCGYLSIALGANGV